MREIHLKIDGKDVAVADGTTVLEAARRLGIEIPTLCHHELLEPAGACRLCVVEAEGPGWKRMVVSCAAAAGDGWVVRTRTEAIDRHRRALLELMLARAPHAPKLQALAREYGADADHYAKDPSFCIHCGLCVRYCAEVKQKHAIGFVGRGVKKEICFVPEIAATECDGCKECFPLCPTSFCQAEYVLTRSLAFR